MLTIAYLANQFPSPVEPYVGEEIEELQRRGVHVIAGSVRRSDSQAFGVKPQIVLQSANAITLVRAAWLCVSRWRRIAGLIGGIVASRKEGTWQRLKAIMHTFLGACYAVLLEGRGVDHIHVHHGYFGSWIAMTAARLLGVEFSMTLHGSDLLLHGVFLDVKLASCRFCLTVSEFNRRYILQRFPDVAAEKLVVARLGVDVREDLALRPRIPDQGAHTFRLLAVGRLHPVKDHAFLVQACASLTERGLRFECDIAGEGSERQRLENLIRSQGLEDRVKLLGHVPREQMNALYERADAVVLTSRSEGIPLVLMEAMARGKIVLAPEITGIPELVVAGKAGFLYEPGSHAEFVDRLLLIHALLRAERDRGTSRNPPSISAARQLDWVRHAAHVHVRHNFNRQTNLKLFGEVFLRRIRPQAKSISDANLVLQQI